MSIASMERAIARFLENDQPIADMMRDDERKRGYRVFRPGEVRWLPACDWHGDCVVSVNKNVVRLVLIVSKRSGSLRRLVAEVEALRLIPEVIEPTRELQATLARWGWQHGRRGVCFENRENFMRPALEPVKEQGQ